MSLWLFFGDQETISRFHLHPLGKYLDDYAKWLHDRGYCWEAARVKIRNVARLSPWLKRHGIAAKDLRWHHIQDYLQMRPRKSPPFNKQDKTNLKQFLLYLQTQGVLPKPVAAESTPVEEIVAKYRDYLLKERGLSQETSAQYCRHINRFLLESFPRSKPDLSTLCSASVTSHVQKTAAKMSKKDAKLMCCALRSFLRYARYQGYVEADLQASVPTVANWTLSSIPRALSAEVAEKVLASCDRQSPIGRRDYAVLLLLARLGFRAGEIVMLELDDIDWRAGTISIHGKGSNLSQMPLPPDVGQAIAEYLQHGRPNCSTRRVFICRKAPISGFARSGAVSNIVARAFHRAGFDSATRKGAHLFRHTLATGLLRTGASLPEIAEMLRHRSTACVTIYAKVDLKSLRSLALAWPGGAQ
ncbi:tyrosine-type recombinase/integrase [Candidatus Obscuribacterales bacterium]|nr:tyrosine-type recombinase/integrase [Candidatus Obscuribacterales bacterium]